MSQDLPCQRHRPAAPVLSTGDGRLLTCDERAAIAGNGVRRKPVGDDALGPDRDPGAPGDGMRPIPRAIAPHNLPVAFTSDSHAARSIEGNGIGSGAGTTWFRIPSIAETRKGRHS